MTIPTEPIGSIPRPKYLQVARASVQHGNSTEDIEMLNNRAVVETLREFEKTGSPVVTDGEQSKPSFVAYPLRDLPQLDPRGLAISFADGHTRILPKLTRGPFRYGMYASRYLTFAKANTHLPVKQAVISASALSLLYPPEGIESYPRAQFIDDLVKESSTEINMCFEAGAASVQIDFTEARLALKLDPSGQLLRTFVDLNNRILSQVHPSWLGKVGVHTCPGGDQDSTHSADIPYSELIPILFQLHVDTFFLAFAAEKDKPTVLQAIASNLRPAHKIFLGVTNVLDPRVETPQEVCETILGAASVIPASQLGTTDDCGFSPFSDDTSTAREIAFAKIRSRVEGTKLAERVLANFPCVT